jgi:CheY-like chemotaxis protein
MGHKILLADDSITIQKVSELTFTDEDFELHTVGNGQKAIEEIRTAKPDIVLCDIIMPEKSGYEVCEHIKSSEDLKHIPVLLLTGAFEPFDQDRAKKAGCDGFLAKPFEPQTLISKVKELLKAPARAAASPASEPGATTEAAPPPQAPAPAGETIDTTVMMSSEAGLASPPAPPAPTVPPASPEPAVPPEGVGFQEDFAVEAGERELSVDSQDRTMFLGQEEPSGPTEDIWSEVQGPSSPSPPATPADAPGDVDEGRTVMMSSPIAPEPPSVSEPPKADTPGAPDTPDTLDPIERKDVKGPEDIPRDLGFTELPSPPAEATAGESPWVIPGPEDAGGTSGASAASTEGGAESAEPELTPLGDFGGFDDFTADKPGPAGGDAAVSLLPPTPPAPEVAPSKSEDEPFAELASTVPPSGGKPEAAPTPPAAPDSGAGATQAATAAASAQPTQNALETDALAEQIAKKVLSKLSEKVIQEIAWEVVPDLAEALIQKEIAAIKAKIPK